MRIAFARFFRIQVRHGWYASGTTRDDFEVVPAPSTAAMLDELGLRVRLHPDGLTVFGEIEPDSAPPALRRPLGTSSLRMAFEVRGRNMPLLNITDLPARAPARTIFCFDNLREDIASGRKHLGDRPANARIGPAVTLVTSDVHSYTLGAPAASATITIRDRFGATAATVDARSPDQLTAQADHRLDLAGMPALRPGRYDITDDRGGAAKIYYDRGLAASRPLGVIEIFTRTDGLTPDATNRVPSSYRFISDAGDTLTDPALYVLQFEAVATTWRYLVTKKFTNNGIALNQLSIAGPVTFSGTVTGSNAVFTSTAPVRLSATPRGLKLRKQPAKDIRDLPDPTLTTPLGVVPAVPNFVSDMFVYV